MEVHDGGVVGGPGEQRRVVGGDEADQRRRRRPPAGRRGGSRATSKPPPHPGLASVADYRQCSRDWVTWCATLLTAEIRLDPLPSRTFPPAPGIDLPAVRRGPATFDPALAPDIVKRAMPAYAALLRAEPEAREAVVVAHQDVLLDEMTVLLCADFLSHHTKQTRGDAAVAELLPVLERLHGLLQRCRAAGIEATFAAADAPLRSRPSSTLPRLEPVPSRRPTSGVPSPPPDDRATALTRRAGLLDLAGDAAGAVVAYRAALDEVGADSPKLIALLAGAMCRAGEAGAEPLLRQAIARSDTAPLGDQLLLRWTLADVLAHARPDEALNALDEAVDAAGSAPSAAARAYGLGGSHRRRAGILSRLERGDDAILAYEEAIRALQASPDLEQPVVREELAAAFGNLAAAWGTRGDVALEQAVTASSQAVALYEALVTEDGLQHLAAELASALTRYARLLDPTQAVDAIPLRRRAVALYASLPERAPGRRQLVPALAELAQTLCDAERWDDARDAYAWLESTCDDALATLDDPDLVRAHGRTRAGASRRIGSMLALGGRPEQAERKYVEAVARLLPLARAYEEVRHDLAALYREAAGVLAAAGRPDRAHVFEAALRALGPTA
ncbi:MAG: hypothetical protein R3F59_30995 [Myxococcota bacterium]